MIDEARLAEIRRLHYAEHWPIGTIASSLGLHHDTVRRALRDRAPATSLPVRASKLDPFKDFIGRTLEDHPQLRSTRLFDMIRERGYDGSPIQVRRYCRKVRPKAHAAAYLRLSTLPGEQAQVDWGSFGKIKIGHATRTLSCFVMVLGYSRALYGRFFYDQQIESFLRGHVLAFETFGGVPREILYDNLRSVVLGRHGDHIQFNEKLLELAGYYHFAAKPCAPYRPNEKGKVERAIQYLRHSFFEARTWKGLDDLNDQLVRWIDAVALERTHPADPARPSVRRSLESERARLLPLPEHPHSCDLVKPVRSNKVPYVRFDMNDYSIPSDKVGKTLTLLVSDTRVRIADGFEVVGEHVRCFDRGQTLENPEHLAELHRQKRHAAELRGRDRLRSSCRHADVFLKTLAAQGGHIRTEVARLLKLLDQYGVAEMDVALETALARTASSAASVAYILDQRARARKQPPPLDVVLPDDARVRELSVQPHDLSAYDELSHDDHKEP